MLDRIDEIETEINAIKNTKANEQEFGLVKFSNSTTVTNSTGLALPASEKNPIIPQTLANKIETAKRKAEEENVWTSQPITEFSKGYKSFGEINGVKAFKSQKGERRICGMLMSEVEEIGNLILSVPPGYELKADRQIWNYMINTGGGPPITLAFLGRDIYSWGVPKIVPAVYIIDIQY